MDERLSPFEEQLVRRLQGYVASRAESRSPVLEARGSRTSLASVFAAVAVIIAAVTSGLVLAWTLDPAPPDFGAGSPGASATVDGLPTVDVSPRQTAVETPLPAPASPGLPVSDCPPIPPAQLTDGAEPGEARRSGAYPNEPVVEWGAGHSLLIQFPGHKSSFDPADPALAPETSRLAEVRGHRAILIVDVDPPMGPQLRLPSIGWLEDGCPYVVYLPVGTTLDELDEFARSY